MNLGLFVVLVSTLLKTGALTTAPSSNLMFFPLVKALAGKCALDISVTTPTSPTPLMGNVGIFLSSGV
jgi:hypothetical protein